MAKKDKQETEQEGVSGVPAEVEQSALAIGEYDYGEDAMGGLDDVGGDELQVPFLMILQKMSDLVDDTKPNYVDGAKAGMIYNTVTSELFPGGDGITVIPVHREHKYVEWVPRDKGGGFVGIHDPSEPMIMEALKGGIGYGALASPEGNDLIETFYIYGLILDAEGGWFPGIIAFTSTQIKKYKRWVTQMRTIQVPAPGNRRINPPMWSHLYRLRTRAEENAKGSWHGWQITFANGGDPESGVTASQASRINPTSELYQAAKSFRDMVTSDKAKGAYNTVTDMNDLEGDGEGSGGAEGFTPEDDVF